MLWIPCMDRVSNLAGRKDPPLYQSLPQSGDTDWAFLGCVVWALRQGRPESPVDLNEQAMERLEKTHMTDLDHLD